MAAPKKGGYIEKFLKKADKALQDGVKRADEVLDDAVEFGVMTAKQAAKTSKNLQRQATKERVALQKRGARKISDGITAAKKITANVDDDLATLERLGKLRESGVITEREFQAKKKRILGRI